MNNYDPTTISAADVDAVIRRIDRYIARHADAYAERPIPVTDREEVRQMILAEWLGTDWTAAEWQHMQRTGRTIFRADLSTLGQHLRAALFTAGRAKMRRWYPEDARHAQRDRRREDEDFRGTSMASLSHAPDRIAAAVEQASGELTLSAEAQRTRSRKGLANHVRPALHSVPDRFRRRRLRWLKTRNTRGYTLEIIARRADRTDIEVRPFTRYNFRRAGDVPNRQMPRTVNRPDITADDAREILGG